MREQRPHQRKGKAVPDGREEKDVDVLLTKFPVGAIQDQVHLPWWVEGQGKTGEHTIRGLELNEAEQTLVTHSPRAWKLDMILQGIKHDAPSLEHGQNERGQDHQAAGIQIKSRPEGGLQAIVTLSALGGLHRRITLQELTFCIPLPVLRSSQAMNSSA